MTSSAARVGQPTPVPSLTQRLLEKLETAGVERIEVALGHSLALALVAFVVAGWRIALGLAALRLASDLMERPPTKH